MEDRDDCGELAPNWRPDPLGRHQYRYWNGASWTHHVTNNGQRSIDPLSAQQVADRRPAVSANAELASDRWGLLDQPEQPPEAPILDMGRDAREADFSKLVLYTNSEFGFSFRYPQGWREDWSSGSLVIRPDNAFPALAQGRFWYSPAVDITVGEKAVDDTSVFYRDFLAKQRTHLDSYEMLWEYSRQLRSSEQAHEWSFEFARSHRDFTVVSMLVASRGRVLSLNGSCLCVMAPDFQPLLRQVVESLSLLNTKEISNKPCPSCGNILSVDAIRCNKCGYRFLL
jgi:hypothetical protein